MKQNLTTREEEIVKLIVDEYSTQEIAEKLFISEHTVSTHRKNIHLKLAVRNSVGVTKYAMRIGMI